MDKKNKQHDYTTGDIIIDTNIIKASIEEVGDVRNALFIVDGGSAYDINGEEFAYILNDPARKLVTDDETISLFHKVYTPHNDRITFSRAVELFEQGYAVDARLDDADTKWYRLYNSDNMVEDAYTRRANSRYNFRISRKHYTDLGEPQDANIAKDKKPAKWYNGDTDGETEMKFDHDKGTISEALGFESLDEENKILQGAARKTIEHIDDIENLELTKGEKLAILHHAMTSLGIFDMLMILHETASEAIESYYHSVEADNDSNKVYAGIVMSILEL